MDLTSNPPGAFHLTRRDTSRNPASASSTNNNGNNPSDHGVGEMLGGRPAQRQDSIQLQHPIILDSGEESGNDNSNDPRSGRYDSSQQVGDEFPPGMGIISNMNPEVLAPGGVTDNKILPDMAFRDLVYILSDLNRTIKKNTKVLKDVKDLLTSAQKKPVKRGEGKIGKGDKEEDTYKKLDKVSVEVRGVFLKIGEIDTLKEQYHADAFIQTKWKDPSLKLSDIEAFSPEKHWNPRVFIQNSVGDLKENTWHKVEMDANGVPTVFEMRRIKGVFLENLELDDFPVDVQDLSITVATERTIDEVDFIDDLTALSSINTQTFIDMQEWSLHEHVETTRKVTTQGLGITMDEKDQDYSSSRYKHPTFTVTCRAARRPGYFYWNVFFLMFFITLMAFATYSVHPSLPQNRLQLSFTLLLTAVTFKWVVNRCLPTISYLTSLDKYVLGSMVMLCLVCAWHALVSALPSDKRKYWDNVALVAAVLLYIAFHGVFVLWMYLFASSRRRIMAKKDREYLARLAAMQGSDKGVQGALFSIASGQKAKDLDK